MAPGSPMTTAGAAGAVHPAGAGKAAPPAGKDDMFAIAHWRDLWAAVLFYANTVAYVVLAGYMLYVARPSIGEVPDYKAVGWSLFLSAFVVTMACASLLSVAGLYAMKTWPKEMLHGCYVAQIVLFSALTVASIVVQRWYAALSCGVLALLVLVVYFIIRSRLAFSAVVLRNVVECLGAYPMMLVASAVAGIASTLLVLVASVGLVSLAARSRDAGLSPGMATAALIYFAFSTFWTQGVIGNALQTTIAGVYATWYFLSGTTAMPHSPTADSAKRALTYSFGSVCIGSLIVAVIQTLRFALSLANDGEGSIGGAIVGCLLSILESLAQTFNYYAYTMIAIYGKAYVESARDTWRMLSSRGLDVVAGDSYVGACAFVLSLAIAAVSAGASTAAAYLCLSGRTGIELALAFVFGVSFLYALFVCAVVFEIVCAGATATFVCLAEDPGALRRTRPVFFAAVRSAYPNAALNV